MERGLWLLVRDGLRRVPRRSPLRAAYSNRDVLAVALWAALHDRPISWACRRSSWPPQAWRRRLPDQSTMSRRMREPALLEDLNQLIARLQRRMPPCGALITDGKALSVGAHSSDPDARNGRGRRGFERGYKLHTIIDEGARLIAYRVHPMNEAECTTTRELIESMGRLDYTEMLADASYDSNPLYEACSQRGARLIAPRRKPHRSVSLHHRQHPDRVRAIAQLESDSAELRRHAQRRSTIERFFGAMASWGGGLSSLPSWVRRLPRVQLWVAAKLTLDAARRARLHALRA